MKHFEVDRSADVFEDLKDRIHLEKKLFSFKKRNHLKFRNLKCYLYLLFYINQKSKQ